MSNKKLHLIPVGLGDLEIEYWLPNEAIEITKKIDVFIAEKAKTARAFLKLIGPNKPIQEIKIFTLSDKDSNKDYDSWFSEESNEGMIGLVSEAGCPAVADPGAKVVQYAHKNGIEIVPWTGPSSILLGLMGSGLDGQRFTFHGYAPLDIATKKQSFKTWEANSKKFSQTQIFIETPYRNESVFASLLETLNPQTKLCVGIGIHTRKQIISTKTIAEWKKSKTPDFHKVPTIFLFLA